jgi:hypothetical protein
MSGTVIRILEPTHYDFGKVQGGGTTFFVVVAHPIDVSQWREAHLNVRVLETNWDEPNTSTGDDIQVAVAPDPADPSAPGTFFEFEGNAYQSLSLNPNEAEGTSPPTDPYGLFLPIFSDAGGGFTSMIQVALSVVRMNATPSANLSITLYMDLALKD